MGDALLRADGLTKHFRVRAGGSWGLSRYLAVHAVDEASFHIDRGETLALIGESGCGKSTLGRLVAALETPTAGDIVFEDRSVPGLSSRGLRELRKDVQIVFQDPGGSLDPRYDVAHLIGEPWEVFPDIVPRSGRRARLHELMRMVGLDPADEKRHPHQFSGGQQQRIAIARALALEPQLIVCDEPVSALDVSIQAQVLNLLRELQERLGVAYLFISHDLGVVANVSHRIAVMYLGKIVEYGDRDEVLRDPGHPYTVALIDAAPRMDGVAQSSARPKLSGEVPSPIDPPSGCRFRTRCWKAQDVCAQEEPPLVSLGPGRSTVACHFPEGGDGPSQPAAIDALDAASASLE